MDPMDQGHALEAQHALAECSLKGDVGWSGWRAARGVGFGLVLQLLGGTDPVSCGRLRAVAGCQLPGRYGVARCGIWAGAAAAGRYRSSELRAAWSWCRVPAARALRGGMLCNFGRCCSCGAVRIR